MIIDIKKLQEHLDNKDRDAAILMVMPAAKKFAITYHRWITRNYARSRTIHRDDAISCGYLVSIEIITKQILSKKPSAFYVVNVLKCSVKRRIISGLVRYSLEINNSAKRMQLYVRMIEDNIYKNRGMKPRADEVIKICKSERKRQVRRGQNAMLVPTNKRLAIVTSPIIDSGWGIEYKHDFSNIEREEFIQKIFSPLNDKYKKIMTLKYLENYSYEEIAKILNVSIKHIDNAIKRSKSIIKTRYKKEDIEFFLYES